MKVDVFSLLIVSTIETVLSIFLSRRRSDMHTISLHDRVKKLYYFVN